MSVRQRREEVYRPEGLELFGPAAQQRHLEQEKQRKTLRYSEDGMPVRQRSEEVYRPEGLELFGPAAQQRRLEQEKQLKTKRSLEDDMSDISIGTKRSLTNSVHDISEQRNHPSSKVHNVSHREHILNILKIGIIECQKYYNEKQLEKPPYEHLHSLQTMCSVYLPRVKRMLDSIEIPHTLDKDTMIHQWLKQLEDISLLLKGPFWRFKDYTLDALLDNFGKYCGNISEYIARLR
jgi:hypothetical protein